MATESSPYSEEEQLENEVLEELLLLLALALPFAVSGITSSKFSFADFNKAQERFKTKASEVIPSLSVVSQKAVQAGIERTQSELKLKDLAVDFSDERYQVLILSIFNSNLDRMLQTNQAMFEELLRIADEKGWSDEELARRFKLYYGLTPRFLKTVIAMEDALKAEGLSKKVIAKRIQKRIDQLVETRLKLAATLVGTEVVEGSKDKAFTYLVTTSQLDGSSYVKEWVSVVDDVTTQVCLSSHGMIAEIGGSFANGFRHPPAIDPVHPCRSSIKIRKRPN